VPLQVAVPFGEPGQGAQAPPQVATLLFETQLPEQTWYPAPQAVATQLDPEQAKAVAPAVGQAAQTLPQSRRPALSETQTPPQRPKPVLQTQAWLAMSQISLVAHCESSAQPGLHSPVARSQ
jgi:hypothetical protein